jgi:hypothetical protein
MHALAHYRFKKEKCSLIFTLSLFNSHFSSWLGISLAADPHVDFVNLRRAAHPWCGVTMSRAYIYRGHVKNTRFQIIQFLAKDKLLT